MNYINPLDGWFSSGWEEVWLVLYSDSVLLWYEGQNDVREGPKGGVRLAYSPDLIAAGQHTARVPDRPPLPSGVNINQVSSKTIFLEELCLFLDDCNWKETKQRG